MGHPRLPLVNKVIDLIVSGLHTWLLNFCSRQSQQISLLHRLHTDSVTIPRHFAIGQGNIVLSYVFNFLVVASSNVFVSKLNPAHPLPYSSKQRFAFCSVSVSSSNSSS